MANKVGILVSVVDEATGKLRQIRATADDMPNSKGVQSGFGMGIGAGIAMQATQMVIGAVEGMASSVVGGALDEEAALAKLDQAFKNHESTLAANKAAVDRQIDSNTKLGFSEVETTNSLGLLVTATGSMSEAQRFQAAAMDLARLKGIDLATATEGMTKVEAGQYRMLKSLGIVLPAHATALEALTAVEKVAGGQAQTFADTTAGSMASLDASVKDLEDSLGKMLLPVIKSMSGTLKDILPGIESFTSDADHMKPIMEAAAVVIGVALVNALKQLAIAAWGAMGPLGALVLAVTAINEMGPSLGWSASFNDALKAVTDNMLSTAEGTKTLQDAMADPNWVAANKDLADYINHDADALAKLGHAVDVVGENLSGSAQDIDLKARAAFGTIPAAAEDAETKTVTVVQKTFADVAKAIQDGRDEITKAINQVITGAYDPLINKAQQAADLQAIADTQTALSKADLTAAEKTQLDLQLLNQQKSYADDLAAATQYGSDAERQSALTAQLSAQYLIDGLNSADPKVRAAAKAMRDSIETELETLKTNVSNYGTSTGDIYAAELAAALRNGESAVAAAMKFLSRSMQAASPPKEGPLHEIDIWGRKTGEAYVGGLAEGLGGVSNLLGSVGVSTPGGGAAGGGGATSISTGPQTIQLVLDGRVIAEVVNSWNRLHQSPGAVRPA